MPESVEKGRQGVGGNGNLRPVRDGNERSRGRIIQELDDANVFGRHFRGGTWDAWRTFLVALFAVPLTPEQLKVYRRHTGRMAPPTGRAQEAWLVCRRRAGKSFILATIAVFLAAFNGTRRSHRQKASTHEGWSEVRAETGTRGLALPRNCDR